ncbi:MAG: ISL3 family transposase [Nitrospinota bacterium]|nr:ISL3 family transposase [Nitrospinota bacterium]
MHTSDIYQTQGIRGYQVVSTHYGSRVTVKLSQVRKTSPECSVCHTLDVKIREVGFRSITGVRCGSKNVCFEVPVFRVDCLQCGSHYREKISFASKWARHTKAVERSVIELRNEMSIKGVADFFGLDWRTVKEIEKRHLKTKFRRIRLRDVRIIGIDEIYVGKKVYKTIVRDLVSGAVLFVGKGKGGDALLGFERRLRSSQCQIKVVAMDMSAGYSAWVNRVLAKAQIVFDHFHVIKLMNKKLDALRRTTMNQLDEDSRKELKHKRYLILRNREDLDEDDSSQLEKIKETFDELSTGQAMKEKLRSIYRTAQGVEDARVLFDGWIKTAEQSGISALKTMAKTIRSHLEGILAYWKFNQATNAAMEGFNNKIRWLIRQAYGFHDQEYFDLKIYQLPECSIVKQI